MPESRRSRTQDGARVAAFRTAYVSAFQAFLGDAREGTLRAAYELGRDAVSEGVGLLELAHIHQAAVQTALDPAAPAEAARVAAVAGDFLLEALGAYEMVHRGFGEAQETVAYERRQAAMIRRLSTLLADTSLALQAQGSLDEVLRLVVEQARELTGAAWCFAHVQSDVVAERSAEARAGTLPDDEAATLDAAYAALARAEVTGDDARSESSESLVAAPLRALDGQTVGVLVAAPAATRRFTELDSAVLVHIGQMAAAALERAMRYRLVTAGRSR